MILVAADRLKLNIVTLFDALSPLQNNPYNLIVQQRLSILHRKHDVIVYLPCTVVPFAYLSFIYPPILIRRPRGKTTGNCEFKNTRPSSVARKVARPDGNLKW